MSLPKPSDEQNSFPSGLNVTQLLNIIGQGESNNNPNSVRGDDGDAFGQWQMHGIFVDDINLLTGSKYDHSDAEDPTIAPQLARDAVGAFSDYLTKQGITPTVKHIAYIWNGGRSGYNYMDPDWVERAIAQAPEKRIDENDKRYTKQMHRTKAANLTEYWTKFQKNRDSMLQAPQVQTAALAPQEQPNLQETLQQVAQAAQTAQDVPELIGMHGGDVNAGVVNEPTEDVPDLIGMHGGDVDTGVVPEPLN